jgi:hypothetical protein
LNTWTIIIDTVWCVQSESGVWSTFNCVCPLLFRCSTTLCPLFPLIDSSPCNCCQFRLHLFHYKLKIGTPGSVDLLLFFSWSEGAKQQHQRRRLAGPDEGRVLIAEDQSIAPLP